MTVEPTRMSEAPQASLKKPTPSRIALVVGAVTILWALFLSIRWVTKLAKTGESSMFRVALPGMVPWFAAGIALTMRSLRGAIRWPRALATRVGGWLVGAPFIIVGVTMAPGRGDTTYWVLNVAVTILFLVGGVLLLRIGFRRRPAHCIDAAASVHHRDLPLNCADRAALSAWSNSTGGHLEAGIVLERYRQVGRKWGAWFNETCLQL
jgi:hypothetical protein